MSRTAPATDPKTPSMSAWTVFGKHGENTILRTIVYNIMKNESRLVGLRPDTSPIFLFDHGQSTRDVLGMMLPAFLDRTRLEVHILTVFEPKKAELIYNVDAAIANVMRGNLIHKHKGVPVLLMKYGATAIVPVTSATPSKKRTRDNTSTSDGWDITTAASVPRSPPATVTKQFQCIHVGLGVALGAGSPATLKTTFDSVVGCLAQGGKLSFTMFDFEELDEDREPESDSDRELTDRKNRCWRMLAGREPNPHWIEEDTATPTPKRARRPVDGTKLTLHTGARTDYDYGEEEEDEKRDTVPYNPLAPAQADLVFFYVTPHTLHELRQRLGLVSCTEHYVLDRGSSVSDAAEFGFDLYLKTYVWQKPFAKATRHSTDASAYRRPSKALDSALTRDHRNGNLYSTSNQYQPGQKRKGAGKPKGRK